MSGSAKGGSIELSENLIHEEDEPLNDENQDDSSKKDEELRKWLEKEKGVGGSPGLVDRIIQESGFNSENSDNSEDEKESGKRRTVNFEPLEDSDEE